MTAGYVGEDVDYGLKLLWLHRAMRWAGCAFCLPVSQSVSSDQRAVILPRPNYE